MKNGAELRCGKDDIGNVEDCISGVRQGFLIVNRTACIILAVWVHVV